MLWHICKLCLEIVMVISDYFYKQQIGLPVNTSINEKDIKLISKSLKNGW